MQIFIKTLELGTLTLDVDASNTIAKIRAKMRLKIEDLCAGYDVEYLKNAMGSLPLIYKGTSMSDDCTLASYSIQNGDTIRMNGTLGGEGLIRFVSFHFIFCFVLETQLNVINALSLLLLPEFFGSSFPSASA